MPIFFGFEREYASLSALCHADRVFSTDVIEPVFPAMSAFPSQGRAFQSGIVGTDNGNRAAGGTLTGGGMAVYVQCPPTPSRQSTAYGRADDTGADNDRVVDLRHPSTACFTH